MFVTTITINQHRAFISLTLTYCRSREPVCSFWFWHPIPSPIPSSWTRNSNLVTPLANFTELFLDVSEQWWNAGIDDLRCSVLDVGAKNVPSWQRLSSQATSIWAHCLIDIITFAAAMPLLATRIRLIAWHQLASVHAWVLAWKGSRWSDAWEEVDECWKYPQRTKKN